MLKVKPKHSSSNTALANTNKKECVAPDCTNEPVKPDNDQPQTAEFQQMSKHMCIIELPNTLPYGAAYNNQHRARPGSANGAEYETPAIKARDKVEMRRIATKSNERHVLTMPPQKPDRL